MIDNGAGRQLDDRGLSLRLFHRRRTTDKETERADNPAGGSRGEHFATGGAADVHGIGHRTSGNHKSLNPIGNWVQPMYQAPQNFQIPGNHFRKMIQ